MSDVWDEPPRRWMNQWPGGAPLPDSVFTNSAAQRDMRDPEKITEDVKVLQKAAKSLSFAQAYDLLHGKKSYVPDPKPEGKKKKGKKR